LESKLAEALRVFLDAGEGDTPQERAARRVALSSPLEWLLDSLLRDQPGWEGHSRIDGIGNERIERLSATALRLDGQAIVVHGSDKWRYRPMQADLALPNAVSRIRFAGRETEIPYGLAPARKLYRMPTEWAYEFALILVDP
jgi:hypothetical protein